MLLIIGSSSIATTLLNLPATRTTTTILVRTTIYVPSTPITLTVPTTTITTTTTSPCPLDVVSVEVMSSKSVYGVGENVIIYWSGFGGATSGILTLVGPYGLPPINLDRSVMAAGQYDGLGAAQAKDVGSWTATLLVLGPLGCPIAIGSTQFQVVGTF